MYRLFFYFFLFFLLTLKVPSSSYALEEEDSFSTYKGWDHLAKKLLSDGIFPEEVTALFESKNFPQFENIPFALEAKESHATYKTFFKPKRLKIARNCLKTHLKSLEKAEKRFSVDKHVLVSILYVETLCGKITGNTNIIERLVRLANIDDPKNISFNFKRLQKSDKNLEIKKVSNRAHEITKMFYPEILALYEIARNSNTNILTLKGSYAGAFGYTQFLPSSFLMFGVDGNDDGKISLFSAADAIASTANFLSSYGWNDNLTLDEKKQTIWKYNHSNAYVSTVLKVAEILKNKKDLN